MQYSALHHRTWITPTVQKPCRNRALTLRQMKNRLIRQRLDGIGSSDRTPKIKSWRYDYDKIAFLPLQYGHQPGGSPVRGWHHPCHRLHRRGGRIRQHPGTAAELDWLLYNKPLEYAQMVLRGRWSAISASAVTTAGWKIDCCLFQSNQAVLICFAVSLYAAFTVSSP